MHAQQQKYTYTDFFVYIYTHALFHISHLKYCEHMIQILFRELIKRHASEPCWNSRRSSLDFLPAFPLAGDQRSLLPISRLTHLSVLSKPPEHYLTHNPLRLCSCSRRWDFLPVKTMPAVAFTAHFLCKSCSFSLVHLVSLYTSDSVDCFIALPRPAFVKSWFYK